MKERDVPLGAIYATLDIWEGVLLLKKKEVYGGSAVYKKVIPIKKGQLLLFRGDLVHAGSAYSSSNFRLHFYLDNPLCDRSENSTQYVQADGVLALIKI